MMFTAFDVSSISQSLGRWELAEYIFEGLVVIGCAGELVADLGKKCLATAHRDRIERLSTILLVVALSMELICLVKTNELSGTIIGSLSDKAEVADRKAQSAVDKSSLAEKRADAAADGSKRADDSAKEAKGTAAESESLSRSANQEAGTALDEFGKLRTDTKALEAEANRTKEDLVNFAVCNAPRVITNWSTIRGGHVVKSNVDSLRSKGQVALIEVMPDAEARRAALNIAQVLREAEWNVQSLKLVDGLKDGVSVQPSAAPGGSYWHAEEMAVKLVVFLHSYNWQAIEGWWEDSQGSLIRDPKIAPVGSVRIQVGLYPAAIYMPPSAEKELTAALEEEKRKQAARDAEEVREMEARTANMSPEDKAKRAEILKQSATEEEAITGNGPCQTLLPPF
jgi:hypothetical protein